MRFRGRTTQILSAEDDGNLLADVYHYLLIAPWPLLLSLVAAFFIMMNLLFALAYFLGGGIENARPGSFADCFFFSIQTMATIGYGKMSPATFVSNVLVSLEALSGLIGLAMVTGLVFAKFSRPSARVRFSRFGVITVRDGVPCLLFRMANVRGNRIAEAEIRVWISRRELTAEGERVRRLYDLPLMRNRQPLFALTWTIVHPIVETSPLFGQTSGSLAPSAPSFILSLTGFDETFSQTIHARHSYLLGEIIWGARFADVIHFGSDGRETIDYSQFDEIVEAEFRSDGELAGPRD